MTQEGPPGGPMTDEGSPSGGGAAAAGARFPEQPPPIAQSVLWRPTVQELARPDSDATLIFVAQHALAAVEDHLLSAPHQALLGYLVGRVLASLAGGPAPNERSLRHAGRLVSAGRRVRLARPLPAVLRAARPGELSGRRMEAAARLLEQLLVARFRGVARAP